MRFKQLYDFAIKGITYPLNESLTADATKSLSTILSLHAPQQAVTNAAKLSLYSDSGGYRVNLKDLKPLKTDYAAINILVYFFRFLSAKYALKQKGIAAIVLATTTASGPSKIDAVKEMTGGSMVDVDMSDIFDKWLKSDATGKQLADCWDTSSDVAFNKMNSEGLLDYTFAAKLEDPTETQTFAFNTIKGFSLNNAIAMAVAVHFNDADNKNAAKDYVRFLQPIYDYPSKITLMGNEATHAGAGMTPITPPDYLKRPLGGVWIDLLKNDEDTKRVFDNLSDLSEHLILLTKHILTTFKKAFDASTSATPSMDFSDKATQTTVAGSGDKKGLSGANEAQMDVAYIKGLYKNLLEGTVLIDEKYIRNYLAKSDPVALDSYIAKLQANNDIPLVIKTVNDLMTIAGESGDATFLSYVREIANILQNLGKPIALKTKTQALGDLANTSREMLNKMAGI